MTILSSPISTLSSGIDVARRLIDSETNNIAMAGQASYVRTTVPITQLYAGGVNMGISVGSPKQIVDENLMEQLREEHNTVTYFQTLEYYGERIETILGTREGQNTLSHRLSQFQNDLNATLLNPNNPGINDVAFSSLQKQINYLKSIDHEIIQIRCQQDQDIAQTTMQINTFLNDILKVSAQMQSNPSVDQNFLKNKRRELLHNLGALIDVDVFFNDSGQIFIGCGNVSLLSLDGKVHPFGYEPTTVTESETRFAALTIGASMDDVSDQIKDRCRGGVLKAQLELRDTWQKGFQEQISLYAKSFYDLVTTNLVYTSSTSSTTTTIIEGLDTAKGYPNIQNMKISADALNEKGNIWSTIDPTKIADFIKKLDNPSQDFIKTEISSPVKTCLSNYAIFVLEKNISSKRNWSDSLKDQTLSYNYLSKVIKDISGVNVDKSKIYLEEIRAWYSTIMDALKIQLKMLDDLSRLMTR
jgi:flagellar hook-associated protein FlgK